jgi:hypothetical protein
LGGGGDRGTRGWATLYLALRIALRKPASILTANGRVADKVADAATGKIVTKGGKLTFAALTAKVF